MKKMKGMNSLSGAVLRSASNKCGNVDVNRRAKKNSRSTLLIQQPVSAVKIYTAPSLEGGDDEYKKVISGKVDNNKPSFA